MQTNEKKMQSQDKLQIKMQKKNVRQMQIKVQMQVKA